MPSLVQALPASDLNFYRIIATFWGFELVSNDPDEALKELAETVCDAELIDELFSTLPQTAVDALTFLYAKNGSFPWGQFTRKFGELRELGQGKRDREKPYEAPISTTEVLWYRGLVCKSFMNGEQGPQEFAYIPDEIAQSMEFIGYERAAIEVTQGTTEDAYVESTPVTQLLREDEFPGRLASELECKYVRVTRTDILDDTCTYLATRRSESELPLLTVPEKEITQFLNSLEILHSEKIDAEKAKAFLEASRIDAIKQLRSNWQKSEKFNELSLIPGLVLEGDWKNKPLTTREFIFEQLRKVPKGKWWNINSFIRHIKENKPDFQRPAGDYDSWIIKRLADDTYLRGFEHWDDVEGELIRYFITGPLYWLRFVELAGLEKNEPAVSFKINPGLPLQPPENGKINVAGNGKIVLVASTPRAARYQITRFCHLTKVHDDQYHFQVSAKSLRKAKDQGLKIDHLLNLLIKYSGQAVPPVFIKTLKRWDSFGSEASLSSVTLLKFSKPATLQEFKTSRAARYILQELNTTSVIVPADAAEAIRSALIELGILIED